MYFSLKTKKSNIEKTNLEILYLLLNTLQFWQQALGFIS